MQETRVFFLIYSCKKNLKKADLIYDIVSQNLSDLFIPLVIYGDPNLGNETIYEIRSERYLVLSCCDFYEGLSEKTLKMVLAYTSLKERYHGDVHGIIKCDDDLLPNVMHLKQFFGFLKEQPEAHQYAGRSCYIENAHYSEHHFGKCSSNMYEIVQKIPSCYYSAGPMYFLGTLAIDKLQQLFFEGRFEKCFYEDIMIGSNLQLPVSCFDTYVDEIKKQHRSCIQNVDNKIRNLYVVIHGGLGNQLFQIASAFGLAQKSGRYLVVLTLDQPGRYRHQNRLDEYVGTIFNRFPCIRWTEEIEKSCFVYSEMNGENNCFEYSSNLVLGLAWEQRDWLLHGYFQNEKYFLEYRDVLMEMFWQSGVCEGLRNRFGAGMENSYFLHIRRGDYVGNALYAMDIDNYYRTAIEKVLERDFGAHFYVLSHDMVFCRNYGVLEGLNITFMDGERELDTMESLFLMATCCSKGGICANSSFSWWGSWLNKNGEKMVIMPKQWIQRDNVMDVFPRGAILV